MKLNKLFLTVSLAVSSLCVFAQARGEEVTEYTFQPHFYVQGQVGVQETLGETSFGKLLSFNAQLAGGYQFSSLFGVRLVFNSWQSREGGQYTMPGLTNGDFRWKWNYIAPTVNLTADLTNMIGGYNPLRHWSVGLFAGVGVNIAYKNDQAVAVNNTLKPFLDGDNALRLIWDGTKARFVTQFGVNADYKFNDKWALGLELQANVLPDGYNSKKAGNADWYFNGLVGVKYSFGPTYKKTTRVIPQPEPVIVEKIVEKIVEVPVQVPVEVQAPAPFQRDVFFTISKSVISKYEMQKVREIADYMKANPNTKVVITGYADKGTGSMALNLRLSAQRAQVVADTLKSKYGIAADRIVVKSMGESEFQPYDEPELCRVAICVIDND